MMLQPSLKQYIEQEIGLITKFLKKAERRSPSLKAHSHPGALWILVIKQAAEITRNLGNSIYSESYFAWGHIFKLPLSSPLLQQLIHCDVYPSPSLNYSVSKIC